MMTFNRTQANPIELDTSPRQRSMRSARNLGKRHPLFGWMKGTVTIAPGTDLTTPACPEWADIAEESSSELARMLEEARKAKRA
jgi:hypothetical protein